MGDSSFKLSPNNRYTLLSLNNNDRPLDTKKLNRRSESVLTCTLIFDTPNELQKKRKKKNELQSNKCPAKKYAFFCSEKNCILKNLKACSQLQTCGMPLP